VRNACRHVMAYRTLVVRDSTANRMSVQIVASECCAARYPQNTAAGFAYCLRQSFDGIEFDTFQYCRFVSRVIKTAAGWKLGSFEGIYQRDQMQTVDPRQPLPVDWDVLASLRPSYKFIGYTQVKRGYKVNPELLGDDRPDLLQAFYAREQAWLKSGE